MLRGFEPDAVFVLHNVMFVFNKYDIEDEYIRLIDIMIEYDFPVYPEGDVEPGIRIYVDNKGERGKKLLWTVIYDDSNDEYMTKSISGKWVDHRFYLDE